MIRSPHDWENSASRTVQRLHLPGARSCDVVLTFPQSNRLSPNEPGAPPSGPTGGRAWITVGEGNQRVDIQRMLRLGRARENDCLLPEHGVSRKHAIIHRDDSGAFWLFDLETTNGTFLNECRVEVPSRLRDGDRIRIGPFVFVFHQDPAPPAVT